ncbi:MAG: outer membrane protein assembly factor BamD [Prevotella sp.]|nr:outer membrane protein assembly factor BamD [Prevotella sp.]MDY5667163.1 outer membrane protein assembly factor BamD [Alloprevotella sp.]
MNKTAIISLCFLSLLFVGSCTDYNQVVKTQDYEYKYEAAKQYYAEGQYNRAALLIQDVLSVLKGTDQGEESLYLSGMCNMKAHAYEAASTIFRKYYQTYPRGKYVEEARYNCGLSLYNITPEPKLDQTETFQAVTEFQNFIENFPASRLRPQAQDMIFKLQDKLVEKEYLSAKLYYDLGTYIGNGTNGNYGACIVTAENAIKDYPYTSRREDFAILILRAKFQLAQFSVENKKEERYHNAIDEYYGFVTEYPESKYIKEANLLFKKAQKYVQADDADSNTSKTSDK